jgi:hypothetical protein
MARRVSMPRADDLFRPTSTPDGADPAAGKQQDSAANTGIRVVPTPAGDDSDAKKRASGRIKHDEKMTVYVTSAELLDLERTRLELRAEHGLAVDRGRLVREAIDLVLADFHERGDDSMLVRGLLDE